MTAKHRWTTDSTLPQTHHANANGRSAMIRILCNPIYVITLTDGSNQGEQIGITLKECEEKAEHFLDTGEGLGDAKPVGTAQTILDQLQAKYSLSAPVIPKITDFSVLTTICSK